MRSPYELTWKEQEVIAAEAANKAIGFGPTSGMVTAPAEEVLKVAHRAAGIALDIAKAKYKVAHKENHHGHERVKMRQRVERLIARRIILDALHAGYGININNGGDQEELSEPSRNIKEILAAMFATDDEYIYIYRKEDEKWKQIGWVYLVYGNGGWDVVSDYTAYLDKLGLMKGADKISEMCS
jgi:hypothetical protein